jgi:hypothetical protein
MGTSGGEGIWKGLKRVNIVDVLCICV